MTRFQRSMALFAGFPRLRALRWLPVFAVMVAIAAPATAEAAPRGGKAARAEHAPAEPAPRGGKAVRAYDGTWNVVFAPTRGNCSSGYSVPFMVTGSRVSS